MSWRADAVLAAEPRRRPALHRISRNENVKESGMTNALGVSDFFDTVVVGAGPAGLLAALMARAAGRVLVVDSGADLAGRVAMRRSGADRPGTVTSGFGGAGLFSDGKLCLSPRIGSTVSHRFPFADVVRRQTAIDELLRGGAEAPLHGADRAAAERMEALAAAAGLEYLHYPVRHVGTDQLPGMLAGFRARQLAGVEFRCDTRCLDVRPWSGTGGRWLVELSGHRPGRVAAGNVVLAPGKIGASWLQEMGARLDLPLAPARPKLGFRLEGPKGFLAPLLDVATDPKVIWRGTGGAEARTHCVCFGGDVVPAAYEDLLLVGGHSTSEHQADRSNCALIAAPGADLALTADEARAVVRRMNSRYGGRIAGQRLGDFLTGVPPRATERSGVGFTPSLPAAAPGNLAEDLPAGVVAILRQFVFALGTICPDVLRPENLIYGPAAERWAHRFVVDDDMQAADGLFLVGDGPGLTGGIIAAAETGWLAGLAIARKPVAVVRRNAPAGSPPDRTQDSPTMLTAQAAPIWTASTVDLAPHVQVLRPAEVRELRQALRIAARRYLHADLVMDRGITAADFPLRGLGSLLGFMRARVAGDPGFTVLRGLPVDDLGDDEVMLLLRGLSAHLGRIATQSRTGHLVRHVRATGGLLGDGSVRGHQTAQRLYFHTDGADAAVLLCRRPAATGGTSRLASAASVHNRMLERDPELVAELYRSFHFHMAGGNVPGLPATFVSPVFSRHEGRFSCRYVRHTLLETQDVTGVSLSPRALAAFDAIEDIAADQCLEMDLLPGDLQVVNNHTVLHSRTAYTDHPDHPRHLLRCWLTLPDHAGRRPGQVDEGLRFGWLTDDLQRQAAATWASPAGVR